MRCPRAGSSDRFAGREEPAPPFGVAGTLSRARTALPVRAESVRAEGGRGEKLDRAPFGGGGPHAAHPRRAPGRLRDLRRPGGPAGLLPPRPGQLPARGGAGARDRPAAQRLPGRDRSPRLRPDRRATGAPDPRRGGRPGGGRRGARHRAVLAGQRLDRRAVRAGDRRAPAGSGSRGRAGQQPGPVLAALEPGGHGHPFARDPGLDAALCALAARPDLEPARPSCPTATRRDSCA